MAVGLLMTLVPLASAEAAVRLAWGREVFPGSLLAPSLLGVAYCAYTAGRRAGLLSAALVASYAAYFFALAAPLGPFSSANAARAAVISGSALGIALLMGRLKAQTERAHARRLEGERAQAQRLAAANRELTLANDSLRAFNYVVSHDLKEPARTLETYLKLLEEDAAPRLDDEGRELLHQARVANLRLMGLVESLLALSRAARIDLASVGPASVEDAMRDPACASRFEGTRADKDATVEVVPGIPPVMATREALCQVLGSLVLNGLKHRPGQGGRVRISGRASAPGRVEVLVEDDGPGFPKAILAGFGARDPWDNLPSTSHPRGFGLTIAARAVDRLGGSIHLGRSEALGGALVRLDLPAG